MADHPVRHRTEPHRPGHLDRQRGVAARSAGGRLVRVHRHRLGDHGVRHPADLLQRGGFQIRGGDRGGSDRRVGPRPAGLEILDPVLPHRLLLRVHLRRMGGKRGAGPVRVDHRAGAPARRARVHQAAGDRPTVRGFPDHFAGPQDLPRTRAEQLDHRRHPARGPDRRRHSHRAGIRVVGRNPRPHHPGGATGRYHRDHPRRAGGIHGAGVRSQLVRDGPLPRQRE